MPADLFYKPTDGWPGDFIPFFWNGEYHLFYLKDYRDRARCGEGTPWFHLGTRDFLHFADYGEALPRGTAEEQDLYVFTGSVIEAGGQFHIFYTGHNPHLRARGLPEQGVMHAVSHDLVTWEKQPADTFYAPRELFEPHDWRDPFVFWNAESGEYNMLLAARLPGGPSRRRGCTALCTSEDLRHWRVTAPLYAPHLYYTHECPDLFRMGDWWYLLFSEFSDASVTRYRMAHSLAGPWLTPPMDTFDGRAFYAAKTASDGVHRYLFGWNPTREGETDTGAWQWGGALVVHEIHQQADGTLVVQEPGPRQAGFGDAMPVSLHAVIGSCGTARGRTTLAAKDGYVLASAGALPETCRITAQLRPNAEVASFGFMLRADADFEAGYYLRAEPARQRLVCDAWPRPGDRPYAVETERPLALCVGDAVELTIVLDGTVCEVYANGTTALSTRMYDHRQGNWGVFVQGGELTVDALAVQMAVSS